MTTTSTQPARPGRVVALVVGCLVLLPSIGAFIGGAALGLGHAFGRDGAGFFETDLDPIETATVAVTTEDIDFTADPGTPSWVIDALEADVRLRVRNQLSEQAVFVGIGPAAAVDAYLAGVAHDEIRRLDGRTPVYRSRSGGGEISPPTDEDFWVATATGVGSQELIWPATSGRWTAVVMNANGAPGVVADVNVGVRADFVLPLAVILLAVGVAATAVAVALVVFGAHGLGRPGRTSEVHDGIDSATSPPASPVHLDARLDADLSRWQWLVKWFLAIPHFIILAFLWLAFVLLTAVAGVVILFTGEYPARIFAFNVGVMRWTWRVSYYATTGGIGTDRYPPFTLDPDPSYPASLDIDRPTELSRGLVLVKWWLLAIPHYLVVGALVGGSAWTFVDDGGVRIGTGGGLVGVLALIAGLFLLFRDRYPSGLFDLIVGLNRWIFRVIAYAALMTDEYPPFRLDQGPSEPAPPTPPHGPAPQRETVDVPSRHEP